MARLVKMAVLALGMISASMLCAEPVSLTESIHVGTQTKTRLHLVLRGQIQVDEKELKVAGQALLIYPERVLSVDDAGRPTSVARFYEDARAKFVVDKSEDPRQLRPDMRLMIGHSTPSGIELFSPSGPMTTDELELVEDVIDTTQLAGLLPTEAVEAGAKWTPEKEVLTKLCDLDGFVTSTIECELTDLSDSTATIQAEGKIHGLSFGSEVKTSVEATLSFDRAQRMITLVEWKQVDSRAPSPVSPPGAYEALIKIERSTGESAMLSDARAAEWPAEPTEANKLIQFEDPQHRYRFIHDRHWHVTFVEGDRAILRRLDGAEMVAQLNVQVLGENKNIAEVSAEQLQAMIIESGELSIDEIIRSESLPTNGNYKVRYVKAKGSKGNIPLIQRHYVATEPGGRQILFTYLTEPDREEKLGDHDLVMVNSIEFPQSTASRKEPSTR